MTRKSFDLDRRTFLGSAGALTLAAGLPGSLAAQEKAFSLGTFGGIYETALKGMMPSFSEKLGQKLELTVGSGAVIMQKLQAGQGRRPPFAAVTMTADLLLNGVERGLLRPFTEKEVPNLAKVHKRMLDIVRIDGGYAGVPMHWKAMGILWRKDLVPFEITSWKDLWRPELKNRISVQTMPTLGGSMTLIMAALIHGGSMQNLEPGWQALKALRPNVREFYTITSNAITSLVNGDTWVSANVLDLGLPLASKGVVATVPKEGVSFSPEGFGVAKNGDEEAAFKFINFMLDDPQQLHWAKTTMVAPSTMVPIPKEMEGSIVENEALLGKLFDLDFATIGRNAAAYGDRFRREIVGG